MKTKHSIITAVFLFICCSSFSQTSKFNVGFDVNTNFAGRFINQEIWKEIEEPKLTVAFGVIVNYRLNSRLALESGLELLNKGYQIKINADDLRWGIQHDGNGGFDPDIDPQEEVDSRRHKYNFYFLAIPFNARYALSESLDKGWFLKGGLAPAFYLFEQNKLIVHGNNGNEVFTSRDKTDGLRKINLNLNLGFGYAFLIKDKLQISIEPEIEYMPFNMARNPDWKINYYSFGVSTRFMIL